MEHFLAVYGKTQHSKRILGELYITDFNFLAELWVAKRKILRAAGAKFLRGVDVLTARNQLIAGSIYHRTQEHDGVPNGCPLIRPGLYTIAPAYEHFQLHIAHHVMALGPGTVHLANSKMSRIWNGITGGYMLTSSSPLRSW